MESAGSEDDSRWQELTPFLDEALDRLKDEERGILLLRFFDRKPFAEVGMAYRISEDAAKMRVSRSLEKLRELLAQQKVYYTSAVIGGLLYSRAVEAAPITLTGKIRPVISVIAPRAPGVAFSRSRILLGTASLLLVTALFVFQGVLRKGETLAPATTVVAESNGVEVQNPSVRPDLAGNEIAAAAPERFDPVAARTVLTLLAAGTSAAIPDARVSVAYFYEGGVDEGHKLTSNAEGKVPIPFANREGDHGANIFVTAEGYVPKVINLSESFPPSYELRLDPALTFSGQVVDEEGEPARNVTVTMQCAPFEFDSRKVEHVAFNSPETSSHTDATGAFRFPYIPPEIPRSRYGGSEVRLYLTADGFETTSTNFVAPMAARSDLRLVIRRGVVVTGRVVGPNGWPVVNAKVRESHNFGVRKVHTETDEEGRFTLSGVFHPIEPKVSIVVQPEGLACQEKTVRLNGRTNEVEFVLAESPIFRGRITDENGLPLADVTVRTDSNNKGIRKFEWLDKSEVDGRFEWNSAPAEETLFWFEKNGFEVVRGMALMPNGTEYQITLKRIGSTRKVNQPVNTPKVIYKFDQPPSE